MGGTLTGSDDGKGDLAASSDSLVGRYRGSGQNGRATPVAARRQEQ